MLQTLDQAADHAVRKFKKHYTTHTGDRAVTLVFARNTPVDVDNIATLEQIVDTINDRLSGRDQRQIEAVSAASDMVIFPNGALRRALTVEARCTALGY